METRKATRAADTIDAVDIQHLLAVISKHETCSQLQEPADRSIEGMPGVPEPVCSPTKQPWRVGDILDAISALLVSKQKHEVIATALRVDHKARTIEFIIAANDDVPHATSAHISGIWSALGKISSRYHMLYPNPNKENSPTHEIKDDQLREQMTQFTRNCIGFNFCRIQKRINNKFTSLTNIDPKEFSENHPFLRVRRSILGLEMSFTREKGAKFGKPDAGRPADPNKVKDWEQQWRLLLALLRECQKSIQDFFAREGFKRTELLHVAHFLKWETYLRKIAAIMNDIDVLLRAALSSRCEDLFTLKFKQQLIPSMASKAQTVPQSAKDWEDVLEKALAYGNRRAQAESKLMKIPVVEKDTEYMARETIAKDLVVHCETKVLLAIARAESDNRHLAKAYSYIGVSKLSCRGCHAFFQAYNRSHGTRFVTKGSHGKSYWPWQFPKNFAKFQETQEFMYENLVERWVSSYEGYVSEKVQLEPDSTAGSQLSRTVVWDNDPETIDEMNEFLKKEIDNK